MPEGRSCDYQVTPALRRKCRISVTTSSRLWSPVFRESSAPPLHRRWLRRIAAQMNQEVNVVALDKHDRSSGNCHDRSSASDRICRQATSADSTRVDRSEFIQHLAKFYKCLQVSTSSFDETLKNEPKRTRKRSESEFEEDLRRIQDNTRRI